MTTLVIDTATAACSVALFKGERRVAHVYRDVGRGHAERLVPMIAELPGEGRADRILVDCGPGSFTGVRVGLAAAIGLGIGWKVPVAGYSTLAAVAAAGFAAHGLDAMAVVMEGGHGELFVQKFSASPFMVMGDVASLKPEAALAEVAGLFVLGSGLARLRTLDPSLAGAESLPDAGEVMALPEAMRALAPRPIYGRAPDAKRPG